MRDRYYEIVDGILRPVFTAKFKVYVRAESIEQLRKLDREELREIDKNLKRAVEGRHYAIASLGHGEKGEFMLGTCDLSELEVPTVEVTPALKPHRVRGKRYEKN